MSSVVRLLGGPVIVAAISSGYWWSEHRREIRHAHRQFAAAHALLRLAEVRSIDVVYDLECGDGTLSILAATTYGARTVCVEAIGRRVQALKERLVGAPTGKRLTVIHADWRDLNLGDASVVVLFSPMQWDRSLRGQLTAQVAKGTRIVSWLRNLGEWAPARIIQIPDQEDGRPVPVMLWVADGAHRPQTWFERPARSIPRAGW